MLATLLAILSSTGVGSLIGAAGGLLNRFIDLKNRDKDLDLVRINNAHQLSMRDKDMEQSRIEAEGKVQVSIQEKESAVGVAEYSALASSYQTQFTPSGVIWVDAASRVIRPLETIIFTVASLTIASFIIYMAFNSGVQFSVEEWKQWVTYVIQWVFFQAGLIIGWWFVRQTKWGK
jgi:hypothetical protein